MGDACDPSDDRALCEPGGITGECGDPPSDPDVDGVPRSGDNCDTSPNSDQQILTVMG